MAIIANDTVRFSHVVKHEYEPQIGTCRDVVVVNDIAQTLKVGTILGKVTATGKYKVADKDAVDGSQTAAAVVIADVAGNSGDIALAATTDTKVLVLARGPVVVANLIYGDTVEATVNDQLKAVGIVVETAA